MTIICIGCSCILIPFFFVIFMFLSSISVDTEVVTTSSTA